MLAQQVVDLRFHHGQLAGVQATDERRIAIETECGKALAGGTDRRAQSEMGHTHIGDARQRHGWAAPLTASAESRPSTRRSHRSLARSVFSPLAMSRLKWSYSSAHVGSSCTSVTASSGGLPLGSTRVRCVKVVGPHLHKERMWAVPFSASTSQVKWLR